uniref:Transcription factor Spi-C n=1 Tax=Salarias fasciatus TaxID=181472 RepID=A0A672HFF5_SALFA
MKPAVQPVLAARRDPGVSLHNTTATLCESVSSTPSSKHSPRAAGSGEFCFSRSLDTVIIPVALSLRETILRVQIRDLPLTVKKQWRKVRLFHFLFEMLEDPSMAHCVSWVPAAAGVFRFSSRNKDQVAALWGLRKGNKRPMTYQKMSRALRNYARSGEIFKVKKKLTYQFSRDTLVSLQRHQHTQD